MRINNIEELLKKLPNAKIAANSVHQPVTTKESLTVAPSKSRYRSQAVTVDGIRYDSKKEFARWQQLCMLRDAGIIDCLQRQVPFVLAPAVILDGKNKPAVRYFADAVYVENGMQVVEDVKSEITRKDPVYRLKKHLLKSVLGVDVREI